ncbi:hypothetical protein [Streptomyces sp. Tue6028]|uniref:hypothetical protein n=1 Tax=Streptomyces sp. Tue6028 TaxID=2036037 RepID=UPI003EBAD3F1
MTSPSLTVDTPAGTVRAAVGPQQDDAVVFELSGRCAAACTSPAPTTATTGTSSPPCAPVSAP